MTNEELNTAIYKKLFAEHEKFVDELKRSPPELVIECAYELVMKEDILLSFEENDLTDAQCRALLKSKHPLNDLYEAWEHSESRHMEDIRDCIERHADNEVLRLKKAKEHSR